MMNSSDFVDRISGIVGFRRRNDWAFYGSVGLVVGLMAGIGVGVLIAPRAGSETRRKLRDTAQRAKDRALESANRARESLAPSESQQIGRSYSESAGGRS